MRASVQIHFLAQFQCRFPATYMELVDGREVGRCQPLEILPRALQMFRNWTSEFQIFAVMACYTISHHSCPWFRELPRTGSDANAYYEYWTRET
jgi:hypothetical protein